MRHARVPANVLIAGEYAVLEEGGLGLAVAVDVMAKAASEESDSLSISGVTPAGEFAFPGDPFLEGAVAALTRELGPITRRIRIDTNAFFTAQGDKRGFGSSAATTVLLTGLWTGGPDGEGTDHNRGAGETDGDSLPVGSAEVARVATIAHRAGQHGRGSGYDIWASALGGVILFRGGARPSAARLGLDWLDHILLFPGPKPVRTPGAVARYTEWKDHNRSAASDFLAASNHAVEALAAARTCDEAATRLAACRRIGVELGEAIGVPATITPPKDASLAHLEAFKAVGAGNELGVGLAAQTSGSDVYTVVTEGLVWE